MPNLENILLEIVRPIVDHPDDVSIAKQEDGDDVILTLSVHADDMGMVIGRHGRIAKAIRSVAKAAGGICNKRVSVEIKD